MKKRYKAFILDLDGCIYVGDQLVPGSDEAVEKLREIGVKIMYLTNNSGYTSEEYCVKLRKFGIKCFEEAVLTSGEVAATYIMEISGRSKILPITGRGFKEYCKRIGHVLLPIERWSEAEYVVVGLDREVNYSKLRAGLRAILNGAKFVATNADKTYPTPDGLDPGAGAIVAALRESSGTEPIVIGKPSKIIMESALRKLKTSPEEVLVVGDRFETDVLAGKNIGADTALVLTGVSRREDLVGLPPNLKPTYVAENLLKLIEIIYA
ncbi:MAG: hypothetical protein DRN49_00430 [Thaumarchaeota archaeon]|nr:MAG: hypothetical protein DRN49_00430 [Nitrososphaerota archaeon]